MEDKYDVTVYRYDSYYDSVEEAQVTVEAPLGVWLPAFNSDGEYIYLKTKEEAIQTRKLYLQYQLEDIKYKLAQIDKGE